MTGKNKKYKVFGFALFLSFLSGAISSQTMETFFQDSENERKFQLSQQNGTIDSVRKQLLNVCLDATNVKKPEKFDCQCFTDEMNKLTDREIFFESVSAYQHYLKMVEAKKAGDTNEYIRLKQEKDGKQGFAKKLEAKCQTK